MMYLAGAYASLGNPEQGLELVERAVALFREYLPPNHPWLGASVDLLGELVNNAGDIERAQRLHEEALGIWQQVLEEGQVSGSLARTYQSLGAIRLRKGDFPGARSYLDRSEEIFERLDGPIRRYLANTLYWQAIIDADVDHNREAALSRLERALAIQESEFVQDHGQTWHVRYWLGRVHYRFGDLETAKEQFDRALGVLESTPERDSYGEAMSMAGLGAVLAATGEPETGREHLEHALEVLERSGVATPPDADWAARRLAIVHRRNGDVDGARQLLERNLEKLEVNMGRDHPLLTHTLYDLANLELEAGNLERSRQLNLRTLEIHRKLWEPGHYVNTWALYQLACIAAREGQPEQALDLLQEALDCGYDRDTILEDPDFASLRGTPEFEVILAEVQRRLANK